MDDHLRDATKKMDFISREAALSCFHDWIDRYGHEHTADEMVEYQKIEELPAADVRPVVRGEWIVDSIATNIFHCSVCGNDAPVEPTGGTEYKSNFCPSCGAVMREG